MCNITYDLYHSCIWWNFALMEIIIVITHRDLRDLLLTILFVTQILLTVSYCSISHCFLPWFMGMLSLLAVLHSYPHVWHSCVLEIESIYCTVNFYTNSYVCDVLLLSYILIAWTIPVFLWIHIKNRHSDNGCINVYALTVTHLYCQ